MVTDLSQEDTNTAYFLMEAPDLLDQIERELLSLRQDPTTQRIHTLMRAAHTLKGAAASVGLQGLKQLAHELEGSFKTLYDPEVQIDHRLETLLYQGVERLRAPLQILLSGGQISDAQVLAQAEPVLAQLREHLGEALQREIPLPSSLELGFDVAQSIFEMGVEQRLQELEAALVDPNPDTLVEQLRTQAEVFIGLAESLELKGFQGIAEAAVRALDLHPDRVVQIAECVLRDLRQGQMAVLGGDRLRGGEVSPQLQALSGSDRSRLARSQPNDSEPEDLPEESLSLGDLAQLWETMDSEGPDQTQENPESPSNSAPSSGWSWEEVELPIDADPGWPRQRVITNPWSQPPAPEPQSYSSEDLFAGLGEIPEGIEEDDETDPLLEAIYTGSGAGDLSSALEDPQDLLGGVYGSEPQAGSSVNSSSYPQLKPEQAPDPSRAQSDDDHDPNDIEPEPRPDLWPTLPSLEELLIGVEGLDPFGTSLVPAQSAWLESPPAPSPPITSPPKPPSPTVRVEMEKLETLNYLMADLITAQYQQSTHQEDLQAAVGLFQERLQGFRHQLMALQDCSDRLWEIPTPTPVPGDFDPLELDQFSELQVLIQTLLEDSLQLEEAGEAVDLYTRQSSLTQARQQRLLTQTRDTLIAARMVPLKDLFQRFAGLVQYLSSVPDKSVQFHWQGEQVLVDKAIGEKLYDPLLHLMRNAFAHGIEPAPIRRQQGKPPQGQIQIRALQQGNRLTLEVWDDGQGLPFDQIRQTAIATGRISPEQAAGLTPDQMIEWLFEPGFTTADQLTDLSGRGIGLDVVRSQLQTIGGEVQVNSRPQQGTCFALQIPLSLTITQLLLCQVQQRTYALLTAAIHQILLPRPDQIQTLRGQRALRWGSNGQPRLIPIYRLTDLLSYHYPWPAHTAENRSLPRAAMGSASQPQSEHPLVILQQEGTLFALEVEGLIGEQELVIKPLAPLLDPPPYVQGCSPLGDGGLALVIDGVELVRRTLTERPARSRPQLPASPPALRSPDPRPTILVVDDSITLRQTLTATLERADYQVIQAKDGREALEQLQRAPVTIAAVICDIEMPQLNGFEFLTQRQYQPELRSIPVVILTSRSSDKHRQLALELGAQVYLTKPLQGAELLETLASILTDP